MKRGWILLVVLGLLFGATAWWWLRPTPNDNALRARAVAMWGLGDFLARSHPGAQIVVVSNPFARRSGSSDDFAETEQAGLDGLRAGLANRGTVKAVVVPELQPGAETDPRALLLDADTTTPLSYLVAPDAFDKLWRQQGECEVIVSLIGLPADLGKVAIWNQPGKPSFALLLPDLSFIGGVAAIRQVMQSGKLLAFVLPKPGGLGSETPLRGDTASEFDQRFLLVTAENLDRLLSAHPQLL